MFLTSVRKGLLSGEIRVYKKLAMKESVMQFEKKKEIETYCSRAYCWIITIDYSLCLFSCYYDVNGEYVISRS